MFPVPWGGMKKSRTTKFPTYFVLAGCMGALVFLLAISSSKHTESARQASSPTNVAASPGVNASFKEGGKKIAGGAQDIAHAVGDRAVKTWDTVKTGATKTGDGIKQGAQKTGEAIKD